MRLHFYIFFDKSPVLSQARTQMCTSSKDKKIMNYWRLYLFSTFKGDFSILFWNINVLKQHYWTLSKQERFCYMPLAISVGDAWIFFSCILWISFSGNITFISRLKPNNKKVYGLSCNVLPVFVIANGTHRPPTCKDKLFISQIAYFGTTYKQPIVSLYLCSRLLALFNK